jgi:uncharacterized damage-inducible protein DinB
MGRNDGRLQQLLRYVDEAYNRKSWHGTNLRGSVRGLTAEQARWRPAEGRHNIHELVVHAAYWKYAVANRLLRGRRGEFALKGSNWFERGGGDREWPDDVALMDRVHRELRAVIAARGGDGLDRPLPRSTMTPSALIMGIAAHDIYHAGQIQLIKKLLRSTTISP